MAESSHQREGTACAIRTLRCASAHLRVEHHERRHADRARANGGQRHQNARAPPVTPSSADRVRVKFPDIRPIPAHHRLAEQQQHGRDRAALRRASWYERSFSLAVASPIEHPNC